MRVFILLLALGVATIFVVQNLQLVALVFFNTQIAIQLPISIWMLLAIAAGMLTSALLQLLTQGESRSSVTPAVEPSAPPPRRSPPPAPAFSRQPPPPPADNFIRDEKKDLTEKRSEPESDVPLGDEDEGNYRKYEVQRPPKKSSQSGSVYSYTYKEPKNIKSDQTEEVYDADYRLITPPYPQKTDQAKDQETEDDDWI